ncbi:hypothetical protein [Brevundimonas nasdae]|uniref:hypothetical protein n=1 Tax=Brevundimonas nasdae TaxID=172043 RepID=UPI003F69238C
MTPRRIDRAAVQARLADVPRWITETLLDDFEPAALTAAHAVEKAKKKAGAPKGARRAHREDVDD